MNQAFHELWEKLATLADLLREQYGYNVDITKFDEEEQEAIYFNIRLIKQKKMKENYFG